MSVSRRGFLTAASIGVGAAVASTVRGPVAGANPFTTGSLGMAQDMLQAVSTGSGMIQPNGPLGYVGVTFPSPEEIAGRIRFAFPDGSVGDWESRITQLRPTVRAAVEQIINKIEQTKQ